MKLLSVSALVLLTAFSTASNGGAQKAATDDSDPVQPPLANEISADLGPCSADLFAAAPDGKPVYGAAVTTRIQYGLMGVKKLDLSAYTDSKGHLKITNLPLTLKKPLYIHIQKQDKEQIVSFKPEESCKATFKVVLY
jgi:hypothetical protein